MAFTATTEWDVRTTGNDANGGGFDTASTGTDYSQQDSPQVTYTDLVIDGTTNTKCTSAATPFTALHVGNIINVTSGTGFTVQRAQVVSVASSVATCDKSLGTLGSTGGNGKLGGAVATVDKITKNPIVAASGNTVHIKAGTYTLTATWQIDGAGAINRLFVVGYGVTHNDGGTKPLITTATNSVKLIILGPLTMFTNLSLSNTATTRADGVWLGGTSILAAEFYNCTMNGFVVAVNGDNGAGGAGGWSLHGTEIKNCTSDGVRAWFTSYFSNCYIHDNGGSAVVASSSNTFMVEHSIFSSNAVNGIRGNGYIQVINCNLMNNTGDGVSHTGQMMLRNCIIYGNGGYGINHTNSKTALIFVLQANNAFGSNASGKRSATAPVGIYNDLTLTVSPTVSSTNFALNTTAGGGLVCAQAGTPGVLPGGLSTGYQDVGAIQTSGGGGGGAGGGGGSFTFIG